ncbi:MAG: peptidylprolyl isomerase [Candidatus Omnitrophica bacterium]|nr:peptidylprolyl isomerase [Candidatus Omnitrophota bacterium]
MKRMLGILFLSLVLLANSQARILETIDAIVNNELILSGEVDARIILSARQSDQFVVENNIMSLPNSVYQELRPQVLEQMIDELLLFQAIRETLSAEELTMIREDTLRKTDIAMEQYKRRFDSAAELQREQNRRNMTWEEIRQATYQEIYNDNIRKVIITKIINRRVEKPTEEELREFSKQFEDNPPTGEITIQQIQLNVPENADAATEQAIRQKAQEIVLRARGGDPFDFLVYTFSQHEASRLQRGMLPPFKKGALMKEFDPVFDMEIGEISDPIRTPKAYHIVRVVYKDSLEARIFEMKQRRELNEWLKELRSQANIQRRESRAPSSILPQ